jgi:hypothetical protein
MLTSLQPDPDAAARLHALLQTALANGEHVLRLPPGEHHIHRSYLPERFCHVSNNDHGLKRILFDLDGAEDFVLDGEGARLIMHGEVLPVRIGNSRGVTIRNLVIDWERPAFSQATVTAGGPGWLEFMADPDRYPMRVDQGRLIAYDSFGWNTEALWNLLPFDAERGEVSSTMENWHLSRLHQASDLGGGRFRLVAAFAESYPVGTPIVLMHGNRVAPGVWIEESVQVLIQDVTIHHAMAMGLVAQVSRDVTVERLRVVPSDDRLFSSWVDAVHFVDCHGATRLLDCELRGQFDDAVNIHASFSRVVAQADPCRVRIQAVHAQRFGPSAATPGAGLAFYRHADMRRVLVTRIVSTSQLNQEFCDLVLAEPVPSDAGALICSRYEPASTVEVRGCRFGANRGRGILINLEHHIVIDGNHFHVSGRAIESMPDANYWWEGSPVQDLVIRNNHFDDCCFGPCGNDLIYIGPELPDGADPRQGPFRTTADSGSTAEMLPVLSNIRITGNTISHHRGRLLHAHGVQELHFSGNRLEPSSRYPMEPWAEAVDIGPGVVSASVELPTGWGQLVHRGSAKT